VLRNNRCVAPESAKEITIHSAELAGATDPE